MKKKCICVKKSLSFLAVFLLIGVIQTQSAGAGASGSLSYTLKSPKYTIKSMDDGFDKVLVDGYFSYGVPGYPALPCRIFRFAVPYDASAQDIEVTYTVERTENLGKYNIRELPPLAIRDGDKIVLAGKADVYSKDAYFPENTIEYLGFSQMRKWKFVNVKYTPFRYNPISQQLQFLPEVVVTLTYTLGLRVPGPERAFADNKMDRRARDLFYNYSEAKGWYKVPEVSPQPSVTYDYVIITTNSIESSSTKLSAFVSYLSSKGYAPLVITEDEYGGLTGQPPNGTAEKIRKWLIDHYISHGIIYVLLIGDPDPDDPSNGSDSVGEVPMKMCWPRNHESNYKESPTDYFYADLTGNWDLNGNGYFGEYYGDRGTGGVDFANEVYVGRIPVYSGVSNLDSVLTKTMAYGNATSITWRKSALLPMSFSDSYTDGAYLSEAMISDYLGPNSYSDYTLYMQGSYCSAANSAFASDQELLNDVSWQRWSNHTYGMVWWWGHGSQTAAYIGYGACPSWSPQILNSSDAGVLDDSHPSHVYQCSCTNGYPENSGNLGTALLYNGAVTTTSASRVSLYALGSWNTGLKYYCDNASIGYYYGQELVTSSKEASGALFDVKSDMGANMNHYWDGSHWMNLFDFNLYGDPSTSIVIKGAGCPECPPDGVIGVNENVTYPAGCECTCENAVALTIGANVVIEAGATVTFTAPVVTFLPGSRVEEGATLDVGQ